MPRYYKNGTPLTWWRSRPSSVRGETVVSLSRLHAEEVLSKELSFITKGPDRYFWYWVSRSSISGVLTSRNFAEQEVGGCEQNCTCQGLPGKHMARQEAQFLQSEIRLGSYQ
jgi:hypothetical protein